MLDPEPATLDLPGIAGRTKLRPEDFGVDEIEAYEPDGRPGRHLLVRVRKIDLSTAEMLRIVGRELGVSPRDIGCAGRKDRRAVTTQWISVPAEAAPALDRFSEPRVEVLEAHAHGQKLRMGHLRGNRFRIVIRDPGLDLETARHRVRDKLIALDRRGGLENHFGEQRFGQDGENLEQGLDRLTGDRRLGAQDKFFASAAQAGLFNLYVGLRKSQGWLRQALPGDVLQRRETGGMFTVEDAAAEQDRLDRRELQVTGPIFGAKMRRPTEPSPSALLEQEVLLRAGVDAAAIARHGKRLPGSRRPLQVPVSDFRVADAPAIEELPAGLELRFGLPAGSYATRLLRELLTGV
jgi:tRNA pseudouridine13 synthase